MNSKNSKYLFPSIGNFFTTSPTPHPLLPTLARRKKSKSLKVAKSKMKVVFKMVIKIGMMVVNKVVI